MATLRIARVYRHLAEVHDVLREMRKVTTNSRLHADRETYLSNVEELAKMYGRNNDETQLPMDMQFAMHGRFSAGRVPQKAAGGRNPIERQPAADRDRQSRQPPQLDRFGDGAHNDEIAAWSRLCCSHRCHRAPITDRTRHGDQCPQRVEDVRDPIGKIGWPKEKGRDGERNAMQWDATPATGFSKSTKPCGP